MSDEIEINSTVRGWVYMVSNTWQVPKNEDDGVNVMRDEIEINGVTFKIGDKVRGEVKDCNVDIFIGTVRFIDEDDKEQSLWVRNEDDGEHWWVDNDTVKHVDESPQKKTYKYSFLID